MISILSSTLLLAGCIPGQADNRPSSEIAVVSVDLSRPGRTIPAGLFGSNIQWTSKGDGILLSGNGPGARWHTKAHALIKDARLGALRFPGGALTNTYRWKHGIGAPQQRTAGLDFSHNPEPSDFGTNEFIALLRSIGLEGVVSVNLSAGAAEAADWVEYMNRPSKSAWGRQRSENGFARPLDIRYWEIGNELYSPGEVGHLDATAYSHKVIEFSRAMKARDPSIKVGAHLEISFLQAAWLGNVFPHLLTWNESVLKEAGPHIDFVSVHFYAPFDKAFSNSTTRELVLAGPQVFVENLQQIKSLLAQYTRPGTEIAVTEYSTFFGGKVAPDRRIASTENALFTAMMLFAFMRDSTIHLANHWSLLNNSAFGVIETKHTDGAATRPTYQVMRALGRFAGMRTLPIKTTTPGYAVQAKGNIPNKASVRYLDAAAAMDQKSGATLVAIVNRALDTRIEARIETKGGILNDTAYRILESSDEQGQDWRGSRRSVDVDAAGGLHLSLPPQSFVLLEGRRVRKN